MPINSTTIRRTLLTATAFIAGAIVASGMHWTESAGAQAHNSATAPALTKSLPASPADFSAVAARAGDARRGVDRRRA